MGPILSIAARELGGFFRTSTGWIVIALYLFLSGLVLGLQIRPGDPASLRVFFGLSQWLLVIVMPAVSMRLVSEELRSGTMETLMAAPISDWQLAIGKYLAGAGLLAAMLLPTLAHVAVLAIIADPDPGPIVSGYVGLVLIGLLYLAVGLLFSSLTRSQVVAFLSALFSLLLLSLATSQGALVAEEPWRTLLLGLSIGARQADFARGVVDVEHVVFFLATSAWFVMLTVVSVEARRWR